MRATPEETYAANAFSIVYIKGGGETWRPVRGIYRISTAHDAFFRAAGRPDLAQRFSHRHATGVLLEGLGTIAGYGGITVVFWGVFSRRTLTLAVGGSMVAVWPILHYLGNEMQEPEMPADDAMDLAGRYNDRLRERLQLSPPAENHLITADAAVRRPRHDIFVAPYPTSGGGGVALVGRF